MTKKRATTPKQKRSKETRQKIKDTAYQLFSEKGYHGTSSNEIASVADVNIGTIYHYFADKKEILLELLADFEKRFFETAYSLDRTTLDGIDAKEIVKQYLNQTFKALNKEHAFFRRVYPLRFSDEDVERFVRKTERLEARHILEIYKYKWGEMDDKEAENRIEIVHLIVATVANRYYSFGKSIGKKKLIDALCTMISHYLAQTRDTPHDPK